MRLILTPKGFYSEEVQFEFKRMIGKITDHMAAIITTAAEGKEKDFFAIKTKEELHRMGFQKVDFIDVEFDHAEILKDYEALYICGGNPFHLLQQFKKSGADQVLKKLEDRNLIVVGVSAGAMILGPSIEVAAHFTPDMNTVQLQDFSALSLFPNPIFPHYGREDRFPSQDGRTIEERLKAFEGMRKVDVIRLKDDQYIVKEEKHDHKTKRFFNASI